MTAPTIKLFGLAGPDADGWSDVAVFVYHTIESDPFVVGVNDRHQKTARFPEYTKEDIPQHATVRRLGRGRWKPACIEMEGDAGAEEKLRKAIRKAGWAVMETSGEWSIHCVTDAAKKAEEVETQLINDNIYLTSAVDATRRALRIEIEDIQRRCCGATHWEGCENDHPACAAIARMRSALAATAPTPTEGAK